MKYLKKKAEGTLWYDIIISGITGKFSIAFFHDSTHMTIYERWPTDKGN